MQKKVLTSDLLLLLVSVIWGFALVAQRAGMEHLGPFLYSTIRFALGSLSLLPLLILRRRGSGHKKQSRCPFKIVLFGSLLTGTALFIAVSLQQIGLVYTTAGKAGFITGLYVVLVPILGIAVGHRTGLPTWVGAFLAVVGLYFLSITDGMAMDKGDFLVLISSFFWAVHVLCIDRYSKRIDPVLLACLQFAYCSVFSFPIALIMETIDLAACLRAAVPILYGGVCSVGIAFTLQVVAQRNAPPAHSAIILSMEGVFAVLGGVIILGEILTVRGGIGCACMLAGMLITQWDVLMKRKQYQL